MTVFVRGAPWLGVAAIVGFVVLLLARSCAYETAPVFRFGAYYLLYVVLPGVAALQLLQRGPISLTAAIALGIPTGHALEIFTFLALAALKLKALIAYVPLAWLLAIAVLAARKGRAPIRTRWSQRHAGLALALAGLFLCTVVSAASQMFAESPLVAGLPQRPIFHDWVYLVSRAASIKQQWPIEDPSLAGAPLQYHYFMLVHAASASWVTKLEVTQVMLRFIIVPLGGVLVVQAFALGRLVSRSAWGGVLAALMTVALTEVSFSSHYSQPVFLGLFTRWLYVSPTFYFGMIFFGALLIAVARTTAGARLGWTNIGWLALLAAAGTGAKGTMTPVVLAGLGGWAAWTWLRERRFPARLVMVGAAVGGGFLAVYLAIMASWGTGQATFEPFRILQLTGFWKQNAAALERALTQWLPLAVASKLAILGCGTVVFAGTSGVRLLAFAQLVSGRRGAGTWLAAVFLTAAGMGLLLHLHAYGELYLFLLIRLPMAVLAAAFIVATFRALRPAAAAAVNARASAALWRWSASLLSAGVAVFAIVAQSSAWVGRQQTGFVEWLRQSPHIRVGEEMATLRDAMLWIRTHTEPDAVLVANAFTPQHLRQGRGDLVDHTTAGVHFYYSALAERRLFVEGPTYVQNEPRVQRRLERAAAIFFSARVPLTTLPGGAPGYAIIDRSLNDGARIALPPEHRVYTNARFEIYQLPRKEPVPAVGETVAQLSND